MRSIKRLSKTIYLIYNLSINDYIYGQLNNYVGLSLNNYSGKHLTNPPQHFEVPIHHENVVSLSKIS